MPDALGDEVEERFGTSDNVLMLDVLCRTMEIDLLTAAGHPAPPPPWQPVTYTLM